MVAQYLDGDATDINLNRVRFVKTMLTENGLNYGAYPKGLFPFHKYKDHNASAFEEHLFEASKYAAVDGKAQLHFTISEEHYHNFKEEYNRIQHIVEQKTNTQFSIKVSYQEPETDTLAVTCRASSQSKPTLAARRCNLSARSSAGSERATPSSSP